MKELITKNLAFPNASPVAFFCAEYAITLDESMYAGGLGVLAADFLFEAGDEDMPLVALGLKYTKAKTIENSLELLTDSSGQPVIVDVPIEGKNGAPKIFLQAWVKRFGDKTFLLLLDPDVPQNAPADRVLGNLYDTDFFTRVRQEIYLGIGGFRLLKALGVKPSKYHLNEGRMAFAALAVLAEGCEVSPKNTDELLKAARAKIVSTKHTILSIGTKISATDLWKMIGGYCEEHGVSKDFLMSLGAYKGDRTLFATTRFLLNLSGRANGVSVIHTVFEKQKYPESQLVAVTNGVYVPRWQSALWRRECPVEELSSEKMWAIKNELRRELLEEVNELSGVKLDPDVCTLVWTRRFVAYKRPMTIFTDMARLRNILFDKTKPLQIIISGKAYGADSESSGIMEKVRLAAQDPMFAGKIAFIPDYSLIMSQRFVTGSDVWLNTPERGIEACGTSGMKAGLNGALMVSVSDGWMDEVNWRDIGWILSDDEDLAVSLYEALERHILPDFYAREAKGLPESWINRMRTTMRLVATRFSATKMLQTYKEKLYSENC
jgi:glycogen phosphorylase